MTVLRKKSSSIGSALLVATINKIRNLDKMNNSKDSNTTLEGLNE